MDGDDLVESLVEQLGVLLDEVHGSGLGRMGKTLDGLQALVELVGGDFPLVGEILSIDVHVQRNHRDTVALLLFGSQIPG